MRARRKARLINFRTKAKPTDMATEAFVVHCLATNRILQPIKKSRNEKEHHVARAGKVSTDATVQAAEQEIVAKQYHKDRHHPYVIQCTDFSFQNQLFRTLQK